VDNFGDQNASRVPQLNYNAPKRVFCCSEKPIVLIRTMNAFRVAFRGARKLNVLWTRSMSSSVHPPPFIPMVEYDAASPGVKTIYDDIIAKRKLPGPQALNNFWKTLGTDERLLKRTWDDLQSVMGPGTLSPLVKEMLYLAVSQTNSCDYCMLSHGAAAKKQGMTREMYLELVGIVAMANETNRLAMALRVAPDEDIFGSVPFAEAEKK